MSGNNRLKQTMLNSIGMFVMISRCWDFCWVCMVATPILVFSLLVEQQSWWRALWEGALAFKGRTKARKVQCHQGVTCEQGKVLLLPLHIKLGLLKQFVKALVFKGETFQENRVMFPKLSDDKPKRGKFVGPQITTMLKSRILEEKWLKQKRRLVKHF